MNWYLEVWKTFAVFQPGDNEFGPNPKGVPASAAAAQTA